MKIQCPAAENDNNTESRERRQVGNLLTLPVRVTIIGRLNALLGEEHFPNGVCGKGVAGARYGPQKPLSDGYFAFAA